MTHTGRKDAAPSTPVRSPRDLIAAGFDGPGGGRGGRRTSTCPAWCRSPGRTPREGAEIVFALGGDGTLLRAAELARPAEAPLLGINLGQVGFLAEAEIDDLDAGGPRRRRPATTRSRSG